VPAFRPAYLIHGNDHGRVAERRARLRAMAEGESGVGGVELFEGDACTPEAVAGALTAMTFAMGRRFVIADGVERWKDKDVAAIAAAMEGLDTAELTVAFFGREEGRAKVPAALHEAVSKAGGQVAEESAVKPWELPKWAIARAKELGLSLDQQAARALVGHVGERQQRLVRELEKLAIEYGPGAAIGLDEVEASSAPSAERKVWTLGTRSWPAIPRDRSASSSSCASREKRSGGSCGRSSDRCARRWKSRSSSKQGNRRRRSARACGSLRGRPSDCSKMCSAGTPRPIAARSRCWATSKSSFAAAREPRCQKTRPVCRRS
jgi:hypothetical protein